MCGTRAPTAKKRVATAMPIRPLLPSMAMTDLDDMAAPGELGARRLGHAVLDHQHTQPRGARPERDREMLGMPGRRVDRFLEIEVAMDVAQEELRDPLVLLIAAGRAP